MKAKPKTKPKPHAKPKEKHMAEPKEPPFAEPPKGPAAPTPPSEAGDLKTEQEKGGKDPVGKAEPSPGPVKTIEDEGIGVRDPYPTGSPPEPKVG